MTPAMEARLILTFVCINRCLCEWVLVPSISQKQNEIPVRKEYKLKESRPENKRRDVCPDMHNYTVMSYAKPQTKSDVDLASDFEISMEDVKELIKENGKIPKTSSGKANFVATMGDNLMVEAEKQIKNLFHTGSRKARFTGLHFPSMEGSLMTISMLLFGVYLSKLIVKLLQSHYAKYNMPIRTIGGIRTPLIITQGRRTRSTFESDIQKLQFMDLVDQYNSKFN